MIADFPLSEHLSFHEMTWSRDHRDLVELNRDLALNRPAVMANLRRWAVDIFEPLRALLGGEPLRICSGYRCAALNNRIPGASSISQHLYGQAGDIELDIGKQERLQVELLHDLLLVERLKRDQVYNLQAPPFPFHQLRFYPERGFVHIGLATGYRDNQITWGCK